MRRRRRTCVDGLFVVELNVGGALAETVVVLGIEGGWKAYLGEVDGLHGAALGHQLAQKLLGDLLTEVLNNDSGEGISGDLTLVDKGLDSADQRATLRGDEELTVLERWRGWGEHTLAAEDRMDIHSVSGDLVSFIRL